MRNQRTLLLVLAAILVVIVLVRWWFLRPTTPPSIDVRVVIASQDIEPYSIISSTQVALDPEEMPAALAVDYYNEPDKVAGLMTTRFIKAGEQISRGDARPIEEVRYVHDMGLEIVSFPAVFNEMIAGEVKPGHKVNIYGYRRGSSESELEAADLILVAGRVWVVDVHTAAGDEISQGEGETQEDTGGLLGVPSVGIGAEPASVLTVAAAPEVVQDIIRALGAAGYAAWVTLSAEYAPPPPPRPPTAVPTPPTPTATPTATPTTPTAVQTPSVLECTIHMSYEEDGPPWDVFPNSTSTVWAVVDLQYSPAEPMPIHIDIQCENGEIVFAEDFTHPRPGQTSYLIDRARGFGSDTKYTTILRVGDKTPCSVEWETSSAAPRLPQTGDDTAISGDNRSGGS